MIIGAGRVGEGEGARPEVQEPQSHDHQDIQLHEYHCNNNNFQ